MENFPTWKIKEIVTVKMETWGENQGIGLNSLSRLMTPKENQAGQVAGRENKSPRNSEVGSCCTDGLCAIGAGRSVTH